MGRDTLTDAQRSAMGVGENLVRISVGLEDERADLATNAVT